MAGTREDPENLKGLTLGKCILLERIGQGGMGHVYKAKHTGLDKDVAVKVLPRELARNDTLRARFMNEARMAGQLEHPNITPVYAVDEHDSPAVLGAGASWLTVSAVDSRPTMIRANRVLRTSVVRTCFSITSVGARQGRPLDYLRMGNARPAGESVGQEVAVRRQLGLQFETHDRRLAARRHGDPADLRQEARR